MDAYLEVARKVLIAARQPLSAREILVAAYRSDLVPSHLHGRTQYKTLHARIAEDILTRRQRSPFVRTEPGRFFCRSLLSDPTIPEQFRREFAAPRRSDQLYNFMVLTGNPEIVAPIEDGYLAPPRSLRLLRDNKLIYRHRSELSSNSNTVLFRVFVLVFSSLGILVHRTGHRMLDRLRSSSSIGYSSPVRDTDLTLFSSDLWGFSEAAIRSAGDALNVPWEPPTRLESDSRLRFWGLVYSRENNLYDNSIGALVGYKCPDDFDPIFRNPYDPTLRWQPPDQVPNDPTDFDAWSRIFLRKWQDGGVPKWGNDEVRFNS